MKSPKSPISPYPPYKPHPPYKKIEQKIKLGTQSSQEDSEFTLGSLKEHITNQFPSVDVNKVKFSFEINKTYGYYDEVHTELNIHYFMVETIDNPNFDKLYAHYQNSLEKYKVDYKKYKADLIAYKEAEKQYKKDLDLWYVENAKAIIAKHEQKNKKGKK